MPSKDGTTADEPDSYRTEALDIPRSSEGVMDMNSGLKMAFAATAVVLAGVACGPSAVAPSTVALSSPVVSPAPVSPSLASSPSAQAARITVAGSALQFTADLQAGWGSFDYGANRGLSESPPDAGIAFFASLVDNTFKDPCSHLERTPKIGSTVEALATALGEVPNTTTTKPLQTTIAGHEATYIELTIPASLPCEPNKFTLWQDSPGGDWWVLGVNEQIRVWILDLGGQRVAIAARSWPGTSEEAKAELQEILDSIVFDGPS